MAQTLPLYSVEKEARISETEARDVTGAVRDALAILDAIEQGGLFEAFPEFDGDRIRHQTGVTLIALLERRLREAFGNSKSTVPDERGGDGR